MQEGRYNSRDIWWCSSVQNINNNKSWSLKNYHRMPLECLSKANLLQGYYTALQNTRGNVSRNVSRNGKSMGTDVSHFKESTLKELERYYWQFSNIFGNVWVPSRVIKYSCYFVHPLSTAAIGCLKYLHSPLP